MFRVLAGRLALCSLPSDARSGVDESERLDTGDAGPLGGLPALKEVPSPSLIANFNDTTSSGFPTTCDSLRSCVCLRAFVLPTRISDMLQYLAGVEAEQIKILYLYNLVSCPVQYIAL